MDNLVFDNVYFTNRINNIFKENDYSLKRMETCDTTELVDYLNQFTTIALDLTAGALFFTNDQLCLNLIKFYIHSGKTIHMHNQTRENNIFSKRVIAYGSEQNIQLLITHDNCQQMLQLLLENPRANKSIQLVRQFVNSSCDLNNCEELPLHVAAENCPEYIIRLLIDLGADPHITNSYGYNTIHFICDRIISSSHRLTLEEIRQLKELIRFLIVDKKVNYKLKQDFENYKESCRRFEIHVRMYELIMDMLIN
jgi:hypothetical protein